MYAANSARITTEIIVMASSGVAVMASSVVIVMAWSVVAIDGFGGGARVGLAHPNLGTPNSA